MGNTQVDTAPGDSPATGQPAKTVGADLVGRTAEEIRQLIPDCDEQILHAAEREDMDMVVYLQARRKVLETKVPLALATTEQLEAKQGLSQAEQDAVRLLEHEQDLYKQYCAKKEERERETNRLQAEEDAMKAEWHQVRNKRSNRGEDIKHMQGVVEEKSITLESMQTGVPREKIAARYQEEHEREWEEMQKRVREDRSEGVVIGKVPSENFVGPHSPHYRH